MSRIAPMLGLRFDRLVVNEFAGSRQRGKSRHAVWRCVCDCGNEVVVFGCNLRNGNTKSCGCLQRERAEQAGYKHGLSKHPAYRIWCGIIQRCRNPNNHAYARYGGRGIIICDRWRYSFPAFIEDMGEKPFPEASVERINRRGNYGPGNCKWGTSEEQYENRDVIQGEKYVRCEALLHDISEAIAVCDVEMAKALVAEMQAIFS